MSGVDLSPEHVRRAREAGVEAYVASVLDLPFADDSFDAGWTMSTLLHAPTPTSRPPRPPLAQPLAA